MRLSVGRVGARGRIFGADVIHLGESLEIRVFLAVGHDVGFTLDAWSRRGRRDPFVLGGHAAGDGLRLAFRLVADNGRSVRDAAVLTDVLADIADAAGTRGMVGGQVVDIESEGKAVSAETLDYIHTHKTAALIRASLCAGTLIAGGSPAQLAAIAKCGEALGLAFQIVDDILDVEGSTEELGKTAGKDAQQQKATYPAYHGLEASRAKARVLIDQAKLALAPLGERAVPVRALADFIFERRS
jgi:geranylgeranyl diphosphate synthase type II